MCPMVMKATHGNSCSSLLSWSGFLPGKLIREIFHYMPIKRRMLSIVNVTETTRIKPQANPDFRVFSCVSACQESKREGT